MDNILSLPFSDKYDYQYAQEYHATHIGSIAKRFSNKLEQYMAKKALKMAGSPKEILDLPCGYGRFWETLVEAGAEKIIAADLSAGMLRVASEVNAPEILKRVILLQTDASKIALPDKSVDCVVSMRLLHHIGLPDHREKIFNEFKRVARSTICFSTWVDNTYKSHRHAQKRAHMARAATDINRHIMHVPSFEKELESYGFKILGHVDQLKYYLQWRTYVLSIV